MGDSRVQDVSLVPSTDCREERLALRLLVAELLQMPHEGLWDDLQLGDEEPLKVAKRFIYSHKLQPKYCQLLKAYKSLLDSHPLPSQSEMNRNLLTTKMLGNDIVACPRCQHLLRHFNRNAYIFLYILVAPILTICQSVTLRST